MTLKIYQEKAINDLKKYLRLLEETEDIEKAYNLLWMEKNILPGTGKIHGYNNIIKGVPHVCIKVPTGGGKTFIACNAIKPIFNIMMSKKIKMVIWLVPTDTILKQTLKSLQDTNHDYRIQIDSDFAGNVSVISKLEALNRKGFNAASVKGQLTILVMSYDSFRSMKKSDLKVYCENGNNIDFIREFENRDALINDVDETALIQVINQTNPLVIVDESHHAVSNLSIEMLKNLNPSFILDLTATPKENSNVISIVEAWELKQENMVKLPVVVYNRKNKEEVMIDAIDLRNNLEKIAIRNHENGGKYIRPIVLFQAESSGKEESTTYDKLKKTIISLGVPKEQIAIKIASIDEISKIDLLSDDCQIRYIITINALKEGWDCSFAYILATLSNRNSSIEVEQIVGRILRQPHTTKYSNKFLNISYILTSSQDFYGTVGKIIDGLNNAGYSDKDVSAIDDNKTYDEHDTYEQIDLFKANDSKAAHNNTEENEKAELNFNEDELKQEMNKRIEEETKNETSNTIKEMFREGEKSYDNFDESLNRNKEALNNQNIPLEVIDTEKLCTINEEYRESVKELVIPSFYKKVPESIFNVMGEELLTEKLLLEGFTLRNAATDISFDTVDDQIVFIDVEKGKRPSYLKMNAAESKIFKQNFSQMPTDKKIEECKHFFRKSLERMDDSIDQADLIRYIDKVVESMTVDQIDSAGERLSQYYLKIKDKIRDLQTEYKEKQFNVLKEQKNIVCKPFFQFPEYIMPINKTSDIGKSLYKEEYADMDNLEKNTIIKIASYENVLWWHRNPERKQKESLCLNGFIKHYPDFIVMTAKGNVLLIETKGSTYKDSAKARLKIGKAWEASTPDNFSYHMVFDKEPIDGAMLVDEFIASILPAL